MNPAEVAGIKIEQWLQLINLLIDSRVFPGPDRLEISGTEFVCVSSPQNTSAYVYKVCVGSSVFCLKIDYGPRAKARREAAYLIGQSTIPWLPNVLFFGSQGDYQYYAMNYIEGQCASDVLLQQGIEDSLTSRLLSSLQEIPSRHPTYTESIELYRKYFLQRVTRRLSEVTYAPLKRLLLSERIVVNDDVLENPLMELTRNASSQSFLPFARVAAYPGDMHLGNVLLTEHNYWVVDPLGASCLPIEYDLGKILCSIHGGYEQLRRGMYQLREVSTCSYELKKPLVESPLLGAFEQRVAVNFGPRSLLAAYHAEICHFLAIIPHHITKPNNAIVFFLRAAELNRDFQFITDRVGAGRTSVNSSKR